jgi:diguanylate cyclase (GGDEF)-like protein
VTDGPDEFFQQLRREYLAEAPARLGELRKDLAALRAGEPDASASLKARFHRLSGSGGSYGFGAITSASRDAEQWLAEHPGPDQEGLALLAAAVGRVAAAFDDAALELGLPATSHRQPPFGWRAHLVGGATDLTARLAATLGDARYAVTVAPLDADPARIPASERPELVIIVPGPAEDPRQAIERWTSRALDRRVAVALVEEPLAHDQLEAPYSRLSLLTAPNRAEAEISNWARIAGRACASPVAVLLVFGDDAERATVATWLESAGLRVIPVATAVDARETLRNETPDLVVLDTVLADADGLALARLLRRQPRMALVPIVAIVDRDTEAVRDAALEAGVDDLQQRPLAYGRVVPAVVFRAIRARRLDEVVRRDPLTGFLTVGALQDEFEAVRAFARREGERLSFILLDIDHFRRINEQLGHQTGDRVLTALARVIRERARASDLVVRMEGEKFGVLCRSCSPQDAAAVAEQIRAAVIASPPVVEGTPLPVRLSAGVAGYPDHAIDMRELMLAAERALRHAKETGRDRVVAGTL